MAGYKLERGDGIKTVSPKSKKPEKRETKAQERAEHMNISVRPISNGFLVSKGCSGPDGEYTHEETYHPTRPKIEMPKAKGARMNRDKDD